MFSSIVWVLWVRRRKMSGLLFFSFKVRLKSIVITPFNFSARYSLSDNSLWCVLSNHNDGTCFVCYVFGGFLHQHNHSLFPLYLGDVNFWACFQGKSKHPTAVQLELKQYGKWIYSNCLALTPHRNQDNRKGPKKNNCEKKWWDNDDCGKRALCYLCENTDCFWWLLSLLLFVVWCVFLLLLSWKDFHAFSAMSNDLCSATLKNHEKVSANYVLSVVPLPQVGGIQFPQRWRSPLQ